MNGKLTATLSARGHLKATLSKAIERVEPIIKPLEITENGNYSATAGVHGFDPVNVNVPLRYEEGYTDGYKASQDSITLQEKTITENGEYETDEGFTGMSKVTVAVPIKEEQEKTVEITKNGTTEVVADEGKSMSKVTVNTNVAFEGDIGKPYIDTSKMTNMANFFAYNSGLINDIKNFDTSNVTAFDRAFYGCTTMKSVSIDTSKGKSLLSMFESCRSLATIKLSSIANATNTSKMFAGCEELESLEIENFDTSKSTNVASMFFRCPKLKSVPFLDVSKSGYISDLFTNCTSLETVSLSTAKTNFLTSTFQNCTALKNITIGEGWAVNIYLHYSNNLTVESLHGMIENLADLTGQTAKTFQIGATNLTKIDEEHINMLKAKNWNYS